MPVLITGATGCIGRALVPKLVATGGQVRVYVRRDVAEYRSIGVKVAAGDADHEGRIESALEQVHTLVHLIGGPEPERGITVEWLNLDTVQVALRAASNAEVRRVLFLSPLGADPASENAYLAAKGHAEDAVRASGLEYVIFRCAPVIGKGTVLDRFLRAGLPSRARETRTNPIAVGAVVDALVAADTRASEVRGTWELGGPEVLTLGELADRSGIKSTFLSRRSSALTDLFARDAIADPAPAAEQFGLTPNT